MAAAGFINFFFVLIKQPQAEIKNHKEKLIEAASLQLLIQTFILQFSLINVIITVHCILKGNIK